MRTRRRRPSGHSCSFDGQLRFDRGGEGGGGRVEREEERVTLCAVLDSAGMLDCGAHDPPVMTEERADTGAGTVQERCRALDVGEQQRPHGQSHAPTVGDMGRSACGVAGLLWTRVRSR